MDYILQISSLLTKSYSAFRAISIFPMRYRSVGCLSQSVVAAVRAIGINVGSFYVNTSLLQYLTDNVIVRCFFNIVCVYTMRHLLIVSLYIHLLTLGDENHPRRHACALTKYIFHLVASHELIVLHPLGFKQKRAPKRCSASVLS